MNLRVDSRLKSDAEKIAEELGLSMSTAIVLFLKAMIREKGLPFPVVMEKKKPITPVKSFTPQEFENHPEDLIDTKSLKDALDIF